MKALAKTKAARGLTMIDAEIPQPGPLDVLIRIKRTAICGTDLHIYKLGRLGQPAPSPSR